MLDSLLLIGLLAILGTGYFLWKIVRGDRRSGLPKAPMRRREDARDWQRRFGADSLLTANFLQPTQNEILETLCVLDQLTPGWEAGSGEVVENHFLHELAMNFPSLRKPQCVFPRPFAESLAARNVFEAGKRKLPVTEGEIAARRESFRTGRAQLNALEQIVAGTPVGPADATPGSPPFRVSKVDPLARVRNLWPARFAVVAAIIAVFIGASYIFDSAPASKVDPGPQIEPAAPPPFVVVEAAPAPEAPETAQTVAAAPPTATPDPVAIVAPATVVTRPPVPAGPTAEKLALNSRIAASQQRAVGKYPDLAVAGSEMNLRFVFRYKNLVQENSLRLLDPNLPEQLAEECAAAAGLTLKHGSLTQVTSPRR